MNAAPVEVLVGAARPFHQPSQGRRGAAGLGRQPLPVPGQQGDLAGRHAQSGPAAWAGRRLGGRRRRAGGGDLHWPAGTGVEGQHRLAETRHRRPNRRLDLMQRAEGQAALAFEGDHQGLVGVGAHIFTRKKLTSII